MDDKKIDELIKLKLKESPPKEYFENYSQRVRNKLDRAIIPQEVEEVKRERFLDSVFARAAFAFNVVLIVALVFLGALAYIHSQHIKTLQFVQEESQKDVLRYLAHLRAKVMLFGEDSISQQLDKLEKGWFSSYDMPVIPENARKEEIKWEGLDKNGKIQL